MSKEGNIGINCLSFDSLKRCGAEEVLLNLCKGFNYYGYENKLVFFCYESTKKNLELICPYAKYVIFSDRKKLKNTILSNIYIQTVEFHKIYLKYNLKLIFFANAGIGLIKYRLPVIVLPHDIQSVSHPEIQVSKSKLKRIIYKCFYKLFYTIDFLHAEKIIAISKTDEKEIVKFYSRYRNKVQCIYNPIDIFQNYTIEKEKENYIIAVNIQYKHKNAITLIKAFELVLNELTDMSLYLVGQESEWTQYLKGYVTKHNLNSKIHFLGFIPREELLSLWKKARLYVNPSLYEGFGMTSVEAVLLGVPTLLSNLPVNREVTQDLCYYFDNYKNADLLASQILNILKAPININELKENQKKLANRYDYKRISALYWKLFEQIGKTNER